MYLCTLLSQTAFKIVSYDDHYLLHQNVYGNEVLDDIWRSITSAIYCDCFEKNSFSKKYKWLIKHYQKRYIANEFDVKFIVNSIAKYLKLDGYIKVNAVVESAAKNNLAGWFIPIAAKGCEINIVVYDGINIEQLITVCFHELIHFFYYTNGIEFGEYNEVATDAALIYFGLDDIAVKGYEQYRVIGKRYINNSRTKQCGYLTPESLNYLIMKKCGKQILN